MKTQRQTKILLHRRFLTSYKKHTLAIFFSFLLTFLLAAALLVLLHTNHRIENIQYQAVYSPSDCCIKQLSMQQLQQLKSSPRIDHLAAAMAEGKAYSKDGQTVFLQKGDETYITMTAKAAEGRLPEAPNEIAAEKWVLLNLGVTPLIGQEFPLQDENGHTKTVKLAGILSDRTISKMYGTLEIYEKLDNTPGSLYTAYLHFKNPKDYDLAVEEIKTELRIQEKQIKKSPAREDFKELYWMDLQVMGVIFLVCFVVFYGIYRIALAAREKEYGILRAVGMKRRQLQQMILLELYQIYGTGVIAGIGAGILLSLFIINISGDGDGSVYLYNQKVQFAPVIPVLPIAACAVFMAAAVGLTGCFAARKIARRPPVETISGAVQERSLLVFQTSKTGSPWGAWKRRFGQVFQASKTGSLWGAWKRRLRQLLQIPKRGSRLKTVFLLSCNYIFLDIKTSVFVLLTICTGVTLFTGLAYQSEISRTYREDTKEMWYLNGQYEMNILSFDSPFQGISRQSAAQIERMPEISKIKTAAGLPVRVIDEDGIRRRDDYYEEINANVKEYYGYELRGNDGTNQIYKSILYGYNTEALKELKKYVVSGGFDPAAVGEDEIILAVWSMDDTRQDNIPGSYKEGSPLMDYHAGDEIEIKYRADFKTNTSEYEMLSDTGAEYIYKKYKIAAVVSFAYMQDVNRTVYPLLITNDCQMQEIVPDGCFQRIYIDTKKPEMTLEEQEAAELKLIRAGAAGSPVRTRSMIEEIRKNEMYYKKQMVYINGIALVAFVLVLIHMVNSLRYRMHTRTREICMLRAVGMSVSMAKKLMMFENAVLCTAALLFAFFLSQPVLRYLYQISDMQVFGHKFHYDYAAFFGISAAALLVCMALSSRILPSWKTKQITAGMGRAE